MTSEKNETLIGRFPYIGIIGSVGVGKSTVAEMLAYEGAKLFNEEFEENPDLERFYTVDPVKYAYKVQDTFMRNQVRRMLNLPGVLMEQMVVDDQPLEGDAIIEEALWKMRLILDRDDLRYKKDYRRFTTPLLKPDVFIFLKADYKSKIEPRIISRGRLIEISMLENNRDYFKNIAETFEEWRKDAQFSGKKVHTVDANGDGYNLDSIKKGIQYYLRGRKDLVLPDFLKMTQSHLADNLPGEIADR